MQISASYTSASLSVTGTNAEPASSLPGKTEQRGTAGDRVALSSQSRELAYSLDLQFEHISVAVESTETRAGEEGVSVTRTGLAAEASSLSASFTMATAGDSGAAGGKGSHLNDEVSMAAKEVKPLVKEFMAAAGLRGGWGQVNRLLRSVS